jgi:hypothetical protein
MSNPLSLSMQSPRARWFTVAVFAIAMAWVESAVVFYLRTMINRIEPYQPTPLPVAGGIGFAEAVRELATLVMLLTVGCLAGRNARTRFAYALVAFGVWDIFYYVFLKLLTPWPRSLLDWDVLFLVPLPWWGPVLAPVCIALLMICWGTLVTQFEREGRSICSNWKSWSVNLIGVAMALYVFMEDAIPVAGRGTQALRELLPTQFNWPLFITALALMSAPVVEIIRCLSWRDGVEHPALEYSRWIAHFRQNRERRAEPDWAVPVKIRPEVIAPLVRSLEQFQLGDGGGPASLIAYDAERFRSQTAEMRVIVDLWFAEEREHSRLLGCAVDRFGGKPITSHWSFTAFCQCRRAIGVRGELQILLLTEIVSTAYYRVMRRHCEDPAVRAMCARILRDEAGHVSFHCDRLAAEGRSPQGVIGALWTAQFWLFGHAAATMLWINHHRCLTSLGGSHVEYYREVRRKLGRFCGSLARREQYIRITPTLLRNPEPAARLCAGV